MENVRRVVVPSVSASVESLVEPPNEKFGILGGVCARSPLDGAKSPPEGKFAGAPEDGANSSADESGALG